jgi:hypothetical protein
MSATTQAHAPTSEQFSANEAQDTMTVRDYFAARAMQSLVRNHEAMAPTPLGAAAVLPAVRVATVAYDIADAMLEARRK